MDSNQSHTGEPLSNTDSNHRNGSHEDDSGDQLRQDPDRQTQLGPRHALKQGKMWQGLSHHHEMVTMDRKKTVTFSDSQPEPSRGLASRTAIIKGIENKFTEGLTEFIQATEDYELVYPEKGVSTPAIEFVDVEDGPDTERWYISTITENGHPRIILAKYKPFEQQVAFDHATDELIGQIYRDIHEMSANGLIRNASEELDGRFVDPIAASVHAALNLRMKEMQLVIDSALLYRQCGAPGGGGSERYVATVKATANELRDGPDTLQRSNDLAGRIMLQRARWASMAKGQGWMILSILANSVAFRTASLELSKLKWTALVGGIAAKAQSLEMFAKLRGLDWSRALDLSAFNVPPLTDEEVQSRLVLHQHHPHEWFLSLDGTPRPCRFKGRDQINIGECDYNEASFASGGKKPTDWPSHWMWPSDPMVFRPGVGCICAICEKLEPYRRYHELHLLNPLVELVEYFGKGVGVRALQKIAAGSDLAEYVGRYFPLNTTDAEDVEGVYHLEGTTCLSETEPRQAVPVCYISAAVVGNWTRFMNHSCEPATEFINACVGGRYRMVVRALRNIEVFEEITVHYGDSYWTETRLCQCGARKCQWSTPEDVRRNNRERDSKPIRRPGSQDYDLMDIDP
ncbi:MAG: hypothetical protein M1812_005166 [Candelaria pacifica]|nr:MAG: hypothetical protein M1812_005166 [Candelaria pacifica]